MLVWFEITTAQNRRANNINSTPHQFSYKTEIKILANPGLA